MIFQLLRLKKIKKSGAEHIELSSERSFVKYSFYHPEYFHEFYFQLKKMLKNILRESIVTIVMQSEEFFWLNIWKNLRCQWLKK